MNVIETIFKVIGIVLCVAVVLMNIGIIVLFVLMPAPWYIKAVAAVLMSVIGAIVATNVPKLCRSIKSTKKK